MKNGNRLVCKLVIIGLHYHIFQCFLDAEHFALLQKEKMDHLLPGLNINDNLFYVTNISFLNFVTESNSRVTTIIETAKSEIT